MEGRSAVVVSPAQAEGAPVARARGARMAVLVGPEQAAPHFITRRFVLEPGAYIPSHLHPAIEHEQVVVRGEMELITEEGTRTVRAGDAVYLPAGCAHAYANRGGEPVEFICVIPRTEGYETLWLEEPPPGAFAG